MTKHEKDIFLETFAKDFKHLGAKEQFRIATLEAKRIKAERDNQYKKDNPRLFGENPKHLKT